MEPDNKQVEQESEEDYLVSDDLLPDGMTVDQLRAEIIEQFPGTTIEELEALGF